ncbi:MAG: phosphoribosyltransferase family protein [Acidimicrobiia bacterium]
MPRVLWRQLRHGIDPASVLAKHLEGLTGCRRVDLLIPPWFGASQARTSRSERRAPIYKASGPVDSPVVLVDDVITTGGTALSAWRALSPRAGLVVTATASAR